MKRLILVPLLVCSTARVFATGGYYEESIPALPVFLSYDRLPKKTIFDISRELEPVPAPAQPDYRKEILAIAEALKAGKAPGTLAGKVDALLAAERTQVERGGSGGINALLHDLRDLCAGKADTAEASKYVEWRLIKFGVSGMSFKEDEGIVNTDEEVEKRAKELESLIAAASPAIKPHYLYAQAAMAFRSGNDDESSFEKVVAEFPDHSRAEAALYMVGRCLSRQSRSYVDDGFKNDPKKVAAARQAMDAYLKKYPQGRFAGDVLGWLGGLEMNAGEPAKALGYFARQLDVPGHPEYAVSATKEIEACFRQLHEDPEALGEAISDARVAQAAVYFASNEIEPVDNNGEYESGEFVAAWRKKLFPVLAKVLAKKPDIFKAAGLKPRCTAALALAASGAGDQARAMKLLEGSDAAASDDIAFARAVVLQRSKRLGEAVEAFQFLAKKFPNSVLKDGGRMRAALALVDDHRAGEAALLLMEMIEAKTSKPKEKPKADLPAEEVKPEDEESEEEEPSDIRRDMANVGPGELAQTRQLLDTIYNCAPVAELAAAAKGDAGKEVHRSQLRSVVAVRYLAREKFAEAKPFVPPAEWDQLAGPLADLTAAATAAKTPAEKASTAMKLADAWAAARGKLLTAPLDTEEWRNAVFKSDHPRANFRRVENGPALGLTGGNVLDLENRDELRHAFNWWITASDAEPKTPQAATAVWRALRAMPDIAQVSLFTLDRAATKKWSTVALKLYERLQKEHPTAPETKRFAVWWTFPPGKGENGEPAYRGEFSTRVPKTDPNGDDGPGEEMGDKVSRMLKDADVSLEALRKDAARGRAWAKKELHALPSQFIVNFFEDLDLFLNTPDLTLDVAKRYVELRYDTLLSAAIGQSDLFEARPQPEKAKKEEPGTVRGDEELLADIRAALADPKFAKVADYVAFLEIAVTANHWVSISMKDPSRQVDKNGDEPTYWGRDYAGMEKMCRAWLEKYPQSRKREAALLLHCRALRHAMEPYTYDRRVSWPVAPRWEGALLPEKIERLKFDAKVWKAELDRYDKEFPKGEYADDVLGYRADLAVRLKDWKRALQITLKQVEGKAHLHPTAKNRMTWILWQLANDEDRADLLAAIRASAGAKTALEEELKGIEGGYEEHPLQYIRDWLLEQLEKK